MTERRALADPAVQRALGRKTHKYGAKRTTVDGITFDSKREAERYDELQLLVRAGQIHGLRLQPSWDLHVMGVKVARYVADFSYHVWAEGPVVVEDVKGMRTPMYRLKAKMLKAEYGIEIREV